jgi:hypothetical protein
MGQSISEIKQYVYDTRDTLAELESVKDYNEGLSNIVDDNAEFLYAGKTLGPADAKRHLGYYTCTDDMFSAQLETSIEAYALGTRIGCAGAGAVSSSKCDPTLWNEMIGDTDQMPLPQATAQILNSKMFVDGALNPDLDAAYAQVAEDTGIPCEVLAGHHFEEATSHFFGDNDPSEYSAANGGYVGKNGFLESVRNSAKGVLRWPPSSIETLITEMSNYNGGGNGNCQLGFPAPIPYGGCPKQFIGEDDPYATNLLDARHTNMYLLYCGDFQMCIPPKPYGADRPGALPAALVVHSVLKASASAPPPPTTPGDAPASVTSNDQSSSISVAGTCGDGYIDTALGCLPYNREAFVSALFTFLVGAAGAIAIVVMLIAIFQIMTAGGNPEQLKKGRELFTAAVTGLLFLIFSVSILRIVAGDIIKLPGF